MSAQVNIIAIITPAPGKFERAKTLLSDLAAKVQANEPGVLKYQVFEQVNSESVNVIVVEECYQDQATFEAHFQTEWFQGMAKTAEEEGLMAAPLDLKTVKAFAGFEGR